ncbi:hypothetical protein B0O99DRAFT_685264 [Bisporella sp. PMI_857]|nr:hypothetical protein B0O99DRAFT_685264 [Bisporella sp. PMI_857]
MPDSHRAWKKSSKAVKRSSRVHENTTTGVSAAHEHSPETPPATSANTGHDTTAPYSDGYHVHPEPNTIANPAHICARSTDAQEYDQCPAMLHEDYSLVVVEHHASTNSPLPIPGIAYPQGAIGDGTTTFDHASPYTNLAYSVPIQDAPSSYTGQGQPLDYMPQCASQAGPSYHRPERLHDHPYQELVDNVIDSSQLQRWVYEISDQEIPFAERLEKSNWEADCSPRL